MFGFMCRIDRNGLPTPLAPEDLAHDLDVVPDAPIRPAPGLPVPSLYDLRAGNTEAGNETPAASERINGCCRHRRIGRRACSKLHNAGAELDPLRLAGKECERGYRVRAVSFGGPYRIIPERFRALHKINRGIEVGAGISDGQAKFHGVSQP